MIWDREAFRAYAVVESAGLLGGISFERWAAIPESFRRDRELDRGRMARRPSESPGHQTAARRLADAIEARARREEARGTQPGVSVGQGVEVTLWESPATVRRPDAVVHRRIDLDDRPKAEDAFLVVEVVSPESVADDTGKDDPRSAFQSRMAQYALAGIEHYWTVWLRDDDSAIYRIQEWRLVKALSAYKLRAETVNLFDPIAVSTPLPFQIDISYEELAF